MIVYVFEILGQRRGRVNGRAHTYNYSQNIVCTSTSTVDKSVHGESEGPTIYFCYRVILPAGLPS